MSTRNLMHRGEVIAFRPNIRSEFFSTDAAGFRNSIFAGETLAVADALKRDRYGLVLGSSHIFGVGLVGDENTLPSLLGERFGFPFANVSLPEGNSRNLGALLTSMLARRPNRPVVVVHFSGGDFTSYCYTSMADPVFGSPNIKQRPIVIKEHGGLPQPEHHFPALLTFTSLWTRAIVTLCRTQQIPVVLGHDTTFFEKAEPTEIERQCRLGMPYTDMQRRWFHAHKPFFPQFLDRRERTAANLKVPLAGPGPSNNLTFIDEFHYDRDGTRALFEDVAKAVEPLI